MAPKRKAPISGTTPAGGKPSSAGAGKQQQNRKRGGQPTAGPSKSKKARVEVEFEGGEQSAAGAAAAKDSAKGKGKGKGKGPAAAAAPARLAAADDDVAASSSTTNSKGKKLAFAESDEPSTSAAAATGAFKRTVPTGPQTFQVVAGSYEKLLYGLQGVMPSLSTPVAERDYSMKPIFIFPAHQACVKTVAASEGGKWLATGSSDEVVKIWDLRRRKEVGGLQQHTGACAQLPRCDSAPH
jgi:protein MAK11